MRRARAGALTASAMLAFLVAVTPATAVEPLDLQQQITDQAKVLGDQQREVQKALDRFYERTGDQMYVVYVPSFDSATPQEWAAATARKTPIGPTGVLLVFATQKRSFGHVARDPDLARADLDEVDQNVIKPALRDDDYAKATIDAAEAYGDLAVQGALPWGWIVSGIVIGLLISLTFVRRSRRRFERTHHVLDEHGNPVDPADILTLEEIDLTSAAALVAVDDALLTSAADLARATEQRGSAATADFASALSEGRGAIEDAFRRRRKLDKLIAKGDTDDEQTERKWRQRASRILATCEDVDTALDSHTEAFDQTRDLRHTADELLTALEPQVAAAIERLDAARETFALLPTKAAGPVAGNVDLATHLLRAAARQLEKRNDEAPTRVRAVEDALTTANDLLDAIAEAEEFQANDDPERRVAATERYVASRRGAVGVRARTLRSEARRMLADDPERADRFAELGLSAAVEDVTAWQQGREASEDAFGRRFDALVLAGILVDETDSGGLRTLLGGSSHGGGSGTRYRGTAHGTLRTAGSFGGTTTRGRRGGF